MNENLSAALASLNDAQRKAVTAPIKDAMQVLAGPGSGKTKVLTVRVAYLIECMHVSPWTLVVMTFTKAAADEMKERIGPLLSKPEQIHRLNIGTFHSVCIRLLSRHRAKTEFQGMAFSILDDADQKEIIRDVVKDPKFNEAVKKAGYWSMGKNVYSSRRGQVIISGDTIRKYISKIKSGEELLPSVENDTPNSIAYKFYEKERLELQSLDFDDILLYAENLLKAYPEVVKNIRLVLVDEYQDVSKIQIRIANLFAQQHRALNVIGDPDQSIYGFRFADPKVSQKILNAEYAELRNEFLEKSYRSTQEILDLALGVINLDTGRIAPERKLVGQNGFESHLPYILQFATEKDQAQNIAAAIDRLVNTSGGVLRYHDIAILLRTNASFREYELKLNSLNVPYRTVGAVQFWQKSEVSRALDYLRLIYNPYDTIRLKKVAAHGKFGIGEKKVKAIAEGSRKEGLDILTFMTNCLEDDTLLKSVKLTRKPLEKFMGTIDAARQSMEDDPTIQGVVAALKSIEKSAQILDTLAKEDAAGVDKEEFNKEASRRKLKRKLETREENFKELIRYIEQFQAQSEADDENDEDDQQVSQSDVLGRVLGQIALSNDNLPSGVVSGSKSDAAVRDKVTISTMHSAKGLEWPVVFVANCHDRMMSFDEKALNEERRVLFVALTRAKALLNVTYSTKITTFARKTEKTTLTRLLDDPSLTKKAKKANRRVPELAKEEYAKLASFLGRDPPNFSKNTLFFSYDNLKGTNANSNQMPGFVMASQLDPGIERVLKKQKI